METPTPKEVSVKLVLPNVHTYMPLTTSTAEGEGEHLYTEEGEGATLKRSLNRQMEVRGSGIIN